MAIRERYQYVVDLVVDGANRSVQSFGTAVDGAEAQTGRFQQTLGRAGSFLRENLATAAVAAGTALVTFGVKSVQAFQDTALEAGKFSEATGLSTEAASRWMEVAEDVGVSGETMRGAFTRLNKAIGDNSPVVAELGLELQRTSDGAVDVNATMLDAISRINKIRDPTERAAAAQKLFGKNYAEVAELIFGSADELKAKLDGVGDARVIDEEEVEKARRMREAMDNLKDAVGDVQMALGEALVPVLAEAAETISTLNDAINTATGGNTGLGDAIGFATDALAFGNPFARDATEILYENADAVDEAGEAWENTLSPALVQGFVDSANLSGALETQNMYQEVGAAKAEALAAAQLEEAEAAKRATETAKRLTDEYNDQQAALDDLLRSKIELVGGEIAVRQAQRDAHAAATELNSAIADGTLAYADLGPALDDAAAAQLSAAQATAQYEADQLRANGSTVDAKTEAYLYRNALQALANNVDGPLRAAIQGYIDDLNRIPTSVNTNLTLNRNGSDDRLRGNRATGGPVAAGSMYEVLEGDRSELLTENGRTYLMSANDGQVTPISPGGGASAPGGGSVAPATRPAPTSVTNIYNHNEFNGIGLEQAGDYLMARQQRQIRGMR